MVDVDFLLLFTIGFEISSFIWLLSSHWLIRVLLLLSFSCIDSWFCSSLLLSICSIWWFELLFSRLWANCACEQWALIKNHLSNKYYIAIMYYNFSQSFPLLISVLLVVYLRFMIKMFPGLSSFLLECIF